MKHETFAGIVGSFVAAFILAVICTGLAVVIKAMFLAWHWVLL